MGTRAVVDPDSIVLVSVDDERAAEIARAMSGQTSTQTATSAGNFYRAIYGKAT